jgi:hypothetical protein
MASLVLFFSFSLLIFSGYGLAKGTLFRPWSKKQHLAVTIPLLVSFSRLPFLLFLEPREALGPFVLAFQFFFSSQP